ncbi:hypothetical protein [Albibacterium indicum]|uniref:hypothetical protein n=1 Tax=Albibacterium indicum TaxID=2292082 RepID=UPI000E51944C|nr:hypothetical protein [Pedobacter indicus]
MIDCKDKIVSFLNLIPRNRLIISTDFFDTEKVNWMNIGKLLAHELGNTDKSKIVFRINQLLDDVIVKNKIQHKEFGETIAIENIGLLLEPELKFNVEKFLSDYSQNNTLILKWEGEIDTNQLYFLTKNDNHKIDLNNISHIVI